MTADKAIKLALLLTATDQMSKVLEKASGKLTGFQQALAKTAASAAAKGGQLMAMGSVVAGGLLSMAKEAAGYGDISRKSAQKAGRQWGGNLIQGLVDGITGGKGRLLDTLGGVGEGIGSLFTGMLGISSPSKVFAQYGLNITQGLVVGIDRGEGAVESAAGGLAAQAIRSTGESLQAGRVSAAQAIRRTGESIQAGSVSAAQAVGSVGGVGGGAALSYAPVINIGSGVSEGTKQDFAAMLRSHYSDIAEMIRRYAEGKERIAF
jgi:hypothetical protein